MEQNVQQPIEERVKALVDKIKTLAAMALQIGDQASVIITIRNQEPELIKATHEALKWDGKCGNLHEPGSVCSLDKYWFMYSATKEIAMFCETAEFKTKLVIEQLPERSEITALP